MPNFDFNGVKKETQDMLKKDAQKTGKKKQTLEQRIEYIEKMLGIA